MSEQSIASARASVMIYDELNKKWIPSGTSSGISKVHIYNHAQNNTFRVVGRKLHDQEVVINCSILKGLKYNQATPTFHQWRDNRQVYGLNFSSRDDAEAFAYAMMHAVEVLNSGIVRPIQIQQQVVHPHPVPGEEDMGYRTMTREDIAIIQERRMSQPPQQAPIPSLSSPNTPVIIQPPGHHRTNSAPQPPPPPPSTTPSGGPPHPPPMNANTLHAGLNAAPPPPPPMPSNLLARSSDSETSLASALANAHLRKASVKQPDTISTTSTSSSSSSGSNSSGIYGTLRGRGSVNGDVVQNGNGGGSGGSLMDEMAKTLARRRALVNQSTNNTTNTITNGQSAQANDEVDSAAPPKVTQSSPKLQRKRTGSDASNGIILNGTNNNYENDFEALKQDILKEVRKELSKVKFEIIDAIKIELNRR